MHNLLKFIPLLAVVAFTGNAMGGGLGQIVYDGNQNVDDDEFLYLTSEDRQAALNSYKESNRTSGSGNGYECDGVNKNGAYGAGDVVNLPDNHYWKGKLIKKATNYRCVTTRNWLGVYFEADDRWVPETDNFCDSKTYGAISVGDCVKDSNHNTCHVFTNKKVDCSAFTTSDDHGTNFEIRCVKGPTLQCVAVKCEDGFVAKDGKCVKDTNQQTMDYCVIDSIREGAAKVGDCFKLWDGQNGLKSGCVSFTKQKCKSLNLTVSDEHGKDFKANCLSNKTFECIATSCESGYELKNGKCEKPGNKVPVKPTPKDESFECPNNPELDEWSRKYTDNAEVMSLIKDIRDKCAEKNISQDEYDKLISEIRIIIARIENEAKVNELSKGLSDMQAKFTTSHWTDKEGNFNKKRLLSDSIAATVLGTTGGLITSHVMKKKQAENGFDALQCTVGGQSVATWGDEFTVGIQ